MRGGQGVRGIEEGSWNGVSRLPRDFKVSDDETFSKLYGGRMVVLKMSSPLFHPQHAKPVRVAKPKVAPPPPRLDRYGIGDVVKLVADAGSLEHGAAAPPVPALRAHRRAVIRCDWLPYGPVTLPLGGRRRPLGLHRFLHLADEGTRTCSPRPAPRCGAPTAGWSRRPDEEPGGEERERRRPAGRGGAGRRQALQGILSDRSGCHFIETATEYDRKPGIKRLSFAAK
jgi:hypothetical protein